MAASLPPPPHAQPVGNGGRRMGPVPQHWQPHEGEQHCEDEQHCEEAERLGEPARGADEAPCEGERRHEAGAAPSSPLARMYYAAHARQSSSTGHLHHAALRRLVSEVSRQQEALMQEMMRLQRRQRGSTGSGGAGRRSRLKIAGRSGRRLSPAATMPTTDTPSHPASSLAPLSLTICAAAPASEVSESMDQLPISACGVSASPSRAKLCLLCENQPADAVLYRCGHRCACLQCAHFMRYERLACPLCRAPIEDVVRIYE